MSRAARRLLGHRCTEPPMLCMTMSHIMRHEPLPRARPRGLSRRRGRRSRRRTYSQRTRGRREVAERRLRRHRQGGVRELGRCAAALHRRLGGVRQRLALAGRHRDVRAHLARGLRLAAGAPANVQLVVAREQHLHHAQVRHRVALVQRAAAQLEEADVVVQRVAPHLEAQVAGAIVAPLEGLGVALGRVDVEWLDELLAALAAARVGRRHRELDVVSQGRIKVERIRLVALAEIGADARWDLSEGLAKRWDGRLAGTR
mmetsp:Transcript_14803/g.42462  ORF Transcript_14803/g.42462 Transcript_14803/m.42462 type:complete len:259 (+) Transcript_14803:304-1080(+)